MILTVTLNPLLERRFLYDTIKIDSPNRGGVKQLKVGGKGINVRKNVFVQRLTKHYSYSLNQ